VTTEFAQGLAEFFKMLRENAGEKSIRIFNNLDDALEWVFLVNTVR
jgi:hypothetical protein